MKPSTLFQISALIFVSVLTTFQFGTGARILSLNFIASKSHKITYDPLLRELAKRGHEVTVVTQIHPISNLTNPKEILTYDFMATLEKDDGQNLYDLKMQGGEMNPLTLLDFFEQVCRYTYALPEIQELLTQKFDLVFNEPYMGECTAGALYKLNTSVILITPFTTPSEIMRILGGPAPPSFIPNFYTAYDNKMNFVERIKNFVTEIVVAAIKEFYYNPRMEAAYREALNDSSIPGVNEIIRNASLTISNSHFSLGGARPFMPNIIEVGGMHMRQAKPLLKDLEEFAQSSGDDGFIFFSMGTILQGSRLPECHRKMILSAFSKLKQKVVWKWETESMADLPSNVKLIKWAPQQDILGHPKIRAFITHGGLGSITEAVYHGVPMIGIPMFGDQNTNIEKFVRAGIATRLDFATMTEKNISDAINLVLEDEKYIENVKGMSKIFRDQRDDPLERAVFWTEYVLRHKGAVHLRSPARDLNFFQYYSLDVIATLLTTVLLVIYLVYRILKKISSLICANRKNCYSSIPIRRDVKKQN